MWRGSRSQTEPPTVLYPTNHTARMQCSLSVSLISIFFSVVHLLSLYLFIITLSHPLSLSVWFSVPQLSLLSYLVLTPLSHLKFGHFSLSLCSLTNTSSSNTMIIPSSLLLSFHPVFVQCSYLPRVKSQQVLAFIWSTIRSRLFALGDTHVHPAFVCLTVRDLISHILL